MKRLRTASKRKMCRLVAPPPCGLSPSVPKAPMMRTPPLAAFQTEARSPSRPSMVPIPVSPIPAVNVASVPQRSPLRYPGGKTWLIPHIRAWLGAIAPQPRLLIEPFAGGGIAPSPPLSARKPSPGAAIARASCASPGSTPWPPATPTPMCPCDCKIVPIRYT